MAAARCKHWSKTHCGLSVINNFLRILTGYSFFQNFPAHQSQCWYFCKTFRSISVCDKFDKNAGLQGTSSVSSAHVAAPLPRRAWACDNSRRSAVDLKTSYCVTRHPASVTRVKLLCLSQFHSATLRPPPDTRMTGCEYKETYLFLVYFFFHHWSNRKPHTKQWKSLSKSTTRDGQHTDLLASLIFLLGTAWDGSRMSQWCQELVRPRRR